MLDEPLTGNVYIGSQIGSDPESGQMYRIFVSTRSPGVRVKFLGNVVADKNTGQLTTSFTDNPELPFEKLTLSLEQPVDDAARNVLGPGLIVDTSFTGASTQYIVDVPGIGHISVFEQNVTFERIPAPGDEAWVSWRAEHGFGLDASARESAASADEDAGIEPDAPAAPADGEAA